MITRGIYSATCSILNENLSLNVDETIAHAESGINNGLHGVTLIIGLQIDHVLLVLREQLFG